MKQWRLVPSSTDGRLDALGLDGIVAQVLLQRGIDTPEKAKSFLYPEHYTPADPYELPDMAGAVERLQTAIQEGEHILIWGDFDVDGQTSSALLVSALQALGARVTYHIPDRFTEGHGIHLPTLRGLLRSDVRVLLTCDTGIAAHEALDYAQEQGVDVVVTDHHALPDVLPSAYALVNPMRLAEGHSMRELPGVGTAYQVVRALYGTRSSEHLLDLVAIGIVADVMVLVDDTRYWLQRGLQVLRRNQRKGLAALIERAELVAEDLNEHHIGFSIAPRLNALGRLANANPAVELLTTQRADIITERVNELEGLNHQRRFLTQQVYEAVQQKIKEKPDLLKYAVLVVAGTDWHAGVLGIVASRLVEDYQRPVIILAEHEQQLHGSARSVAGCNIIEAIASQSHLLERFGGHSMAAGLALASENLFEFRRGISQVVRERFLSAISHDELAIDAIVDLSEISLEFASAIEQLAPFGNGNPALRLMSRQLHVKSKRMLGRNSDHLKLTVADEKDTQQTVFWWFAGAESLPTGQFDLVYTLRTSTYKGKREAQMEWLDAHPLETSDLGETALKAAYTVLDYRHGLEQDASLEALLTRYPNALLWSEGMTEHAQALDRYALYPSDTLIVWTIPPDETTWKTALALVQPETLIVFGHENPLDSATVLFKHLAGMLKYLHKHGQMAELQHLAAKTGQREVSIRLALQWLEMTTPFVLKPISTDRFQLSLDSTKAAGTEPALLKRLQYLIQDTAAYRQFWLKQIL